MLAVNLAGCGALGITGDDNNENEVNVTVMAIDADGSFPEFIVASDGITYEVTADTDFDGFTAPIEILNQQVKIEFQPISNTANRLALEIEIDD